MKHGKRLQKKHKLLLREKGLDPNNWLFVKNLPDQLHVVHKVSGKIRVIKIA